MSTLVEVEVPDVAAYAAAVRRSLVGLTPDQVDDLTDGLEADLADALADERHVAHGASLVEQFGTPERYAAELRTAAGLAPAAVRERGARHALGAPVRAARRAEAALRRQPWWPPVSAFVRSLQPAWWVVRAWLLFVLVAGMLQIDGLERWVPLGLRGVLVMAGCLVVSVQWGRGVWFRSAARGGGRLRWLAPAVNTVAVLALIPTLGSLHDQVQWRENIYNAYASGALTGSGYDGQPVVEYRDKALDGVVVDGVQVSNLFVYDADGNPIDRAQIYDDRGRPVRTTFDNGSQPWWFPEGTEPWRFVGAADTAGRARWNVYPLQGAPESWFVMTDDGEERLLTGKTVETPPWPFAKAPAVTPPTIGTGSPQVEGSSLSADGQSTP